MTKVQLQASLALWRARYAFRLKRLEHWKAAKETKGIAKWTPLVAEAKERIHLRLKQLGKEKPAAKPAAKPPTKVPHNVTMYDSVDVKTIPSSPEAVAGYVGGKWPTYNELLKRFPHAKHISISVAGEDAECLDIEPGNVGPQAAPSWVRRQHARGVKRPILYASLSAMPEITALLKGSNISRSQYRLWAAHYTYKAHIEPGMDATQWTDKSKGRNLDESLCSPSFFT